MAYVLSYLALQGRDLRRNQHDTSYGSSPDSSSGQEPLQLNRRFGSRWRLHKPGSVGCLICGLVSVTWSLGEWYECIYGGCQNTETVPQDSGAAVGMDMGSYTAVMSWPLLKP